MSRARIEPLIRSLPLAHPRRSPLATMLRSPLRLSKNLTPAEQLVSMSPPTH